MTNFIFLLEKRFSFAILSMSLNFFSRMNTIAKQILSLLETRETLPKNLRAIGGLLGDIHPQTVKNALTQLEKRGLIRIDMNRGLIVKVSSSSKDSSVTAVPILGSANCGQPLVWADEYQEGVLKLSPRLLRGKPSLFALRAIGHSMNRANIAGQSIDEGDYVIADRDYSAPQSGDYVVSVIDGAANIKKFKPDPANHQVYLLSESSEDIPPIVLHEEDQFFINAKVVKVVKSPA